MNAPPVVDRKPVTLTNIPADRAPRSPSPAPRDTQRDSAAADVLGVQAYSRVAAAVVAVMVQLAIGYRFGRLADPTTLLMLALGYVAFVGVIAIYVERRRRANPATVTLALTGDLAFIFAMTFYGTTSAHYDRALFGSVIIIHVANVYFGQRQAWRVVVLAALGYVFLLSAAWRTELAVDRMEQLWTVAVGAAGTALIIIHAGTVRRRLRAIVRLFERAEEGDFTQAYDEAADSRPDAITRVGRAYNRVRSQLASMVLTDSLTGCLNRRGFDQALAREVARSERAGSDMALLALDLDHFKDVNDTFGHLVGDEMLRALGALLIHTARAGDVVARIGGEEFAIILPDTSSAGAFQVASRLCELVELHPFPPGKPGSKPLHITTSIGVVSGTPDLADDHVALFMSRADAALYAAKRSGRNRVRTWDEKMGGVGDDNHQLSGLADSAQHRVLNAY
jgi:diguanylate cyclase (GGDEF)-like protein